MSKKKLLTYGIVILLVGGYLVYVSQKQKARKKAEDLKNKELQAPAPDTMVPMQGSMSLNFW